MAAAQRNNRPLSDALQITNSSTGWTVLVQCLHKSKQKVSRNGCDYKNFVFCDMKGTLIAAITYDNTIAKFSRILHPYKRYLVSNAGLKDAAPEYQLGVYTYSWTLHGRTPVEPDNETIPASLPCTFSFVKFNDMYKYADCDAPETSLAIRVLVVASCFVPDATNNSICDYIVINKEKTIMTLRLWGDSLDNEEYNISSRFPQPTIIVGANLKITTHHGLSITTRKNSFFLHDPPYPETDPLLDWYARNADEIKKLVDKEAYLDINRLLPPPKDEMLVRVRDFELNHSVVKASWISATIHLLPAQEKLWYCACHNCGKSFEAPIGWNTTCTACGKATQLEPRCHIGVFLNDESGTLTASLFSPDAEKLTKFTGVEIKEAADMNAPLNDEIERRMNKKPVICFVKHHEKTFRGKMERSHLIVKLYTEQETAASKSPQNTEGSSSGVVDSSLVASQVGEKEKQFFSPNTKLVIENIAHAAGIEQSAFTAPSSPKRSLLFADTSATKLDTINPATPLPPAAVEKIMLMVLKFSKVQARKLKGRRLKIYNLCSHQWSSHINLW